MRTVTGKGFQISVSLAAPRRTVQVSAGGPGAPAGPGNSLRLRSGPGPGPGPPDARLRLAPAGREKPLPVTVTARRVVCLNWTRSLSTSHAGDAGTQPGPGVVDRGSASWAAAVQHQLLTGTESGYSRPRVWRQAQGPRAGAGPGPTRPAGELEPEHYQ